MISDNIANSQTKGYKTTTANFEDLVTSASSSASYASGGVATRSRSNISEQGLLSSTTNATDVAIQGNGFFAVSTSKSGGATLYTRNGAFTTDDSGYLVNDGNYLLGWKTDADGNVVGSESAGTHLTHGRRLLVGIRQDQHEPRRCRRTADHECHGRDVARTPRRVTRLGASAAFDTHVPVAVARAV